MDEAGRALAHLRAKAPVRWVEAPGYRPFWAITGHADIMEIERANTLFTNWPRPVLVTAEADELHTGAGVRTDPYGRPTAPGGARDRLDHLSQQRLDRTRRRCVRRPAA